MRRRPVDNYPIGLSPSKSDMLGLSKQPPAFLWARGSRGLSHQLGGAVVELLGVGHRRLCNPVVLKLDARRVA